MRNHVRFRSTEFTPVNMETDRTNPERYGYALATWVAARLRERGFEPDAPIPEDWGWLLGVVNDGRVVRIGCGNVEGSVTEWMIFLEGGVRRGLLARLLGRGGGDATPNAAYGIVAAIHSALEASDRAEHIEWFRVDPRGHELDHAATPI